MESKRFISGLQISDNFFRESVEPIIDRFHPNLRYTAALVGEGSEVLGFDNEMSCDHDWGPRVKIFLAEQDINKSAEIVQQLSENLPTTQNDYPVNFFQLDGSNTTVMQSRETGRVNHRVEFSTIAKFISDYLAFGIDAELLPADWLSFSEQRLATIVGGKIFRDDLNFESVRQRFSYYPHDLWLYLLACSWVRIEQEQHLMSRAGSVGDDLGSAIIATRLVREAMRLAFLLERSYAPYPKWFGTAFKKLNCSVTLAPHLDAVVHAADWKVREEHLVAAYELLAAKQNSLNISAAIPAKASAFFDRPFLVISCGEASSALVSAINDVGVQRIAAKGLIGSLNQFSDSTDLVSHPAWRKEIRQLYLS